MGLAVARFALAAWIGAAALFVVAGIRVVTSPLVTSFVKDLLIILRFPLYYQFGFTLVVATILGLLVGRGHPELSTTRFRWSLGMVVVGLGVMVADYVWIFTPLMGMIDPPGETKPAEFVKLHEASKYVNLVVLCLFFAASFAICRPSKPVEKPTDAA